MTIDIPQELAEAQQRLPVVIDSDTIPLEINLRIMALSIAQRHVGDTSVKEGALYNALKMDNKVLEPANVDMVLKVALVFERYLWGEWSKGIVENALAATQHRVADAIEKEFQQHDAPRHSTSGTMP